MIFLLQAGFLLMPPCKRAFTGDLSDSPRVQRLPAMLRISSIDDSVGRITKFFIVRGGSIYWANKTKLKKKQILLTVSAGPS